MRKIYIILLLATGIGSSLFSQTRTNAGIAYFGENIFNPGLVVEIEKEKFFTGTFSLPLRTRIGFFSHSDYNAFFVDLHKGSRKYFNNGFFIDQSIGLGVIAKKYKVDDYYYTDKFFSVVAHGHKAVFGIMPSVHLGTGIDLTEEGNKTSLLWIGSRIFWDLGMRDLHLPYAAIQLGYTRTIKSN